MALAFPRVYHYYCPHTQFTSTNPAADPGGAVEPLVSWDLAALLCEASGNAMLGLLGLLGLLGCPRHSFNYLKKARALFMCVRERGMTLYAGLALSQVQL
jgi:hypothetical protein